MRRLLMFIAAVAAPHMLVLVISAPRARVPARAAEADQAELGKADRVIKKKAVQKLLGHSSISTTDDIYTD